MVESVNLRNFIESISYRKDETYKKQEVIDEIRKLELFKIVDTLPTGTDIRTDKIYMIRTLEEDEDSGDTITNYDLYIYENGDWEQLDQLQFDLENYYDSSQIDNLLNNKANKTHTHTTNDIKDTTAYPNIESNANATQKTINTNINTKLGKAVYDDDITDNLITNDNTKVLSAKQGKVLQDNKAPNNHADSSTVYGASSPTLYGHSKSSSTIPLMNGVGSVGTETSSFARGDHIHPTDTSRATSTHTHGDIENDGTINSNITNVNNILVTDNNHNIKTTSSIGTNNITDGSITSDKIADNSITSDKILNGTISNEDIQDKIITGDKLVDGTVTATQLASNSVTASKIKNANVTLAKLNSDVIDNTDGGVSGSGKLITSGAVNNALSTKANSNDVYTKAETLTTQEISQAIIAGVSNVELFELKSTLPSSDIKGNKFYLIPNNKNETSNVYDIYIYVNNNWEKIDSLEFNLNEYSTTSEINGLLSDYVTKLQSTANMNVVTGSDKTITLEAKNNHSHGNVTSDGKINNATNGLPLITGTGGVINTGTFGNASGTFAEGNDSRLSDSRVPKFNYIRPSSTNIHDLNEYNIGGFYYCESDSIYAPYVIHTPLSNGTETPYTNNKAFFLLVETWGETSSYVKQTLTYYNTNITYTRTKKGNSLGWTEWEEISKKGHSHTKSEITDFNHTHDYTELTGTPPISETYTHPTYTARTGKPTANASPKFGETVLVSQIKSDGTGHITSATDRTITIPNDLADGTNRGLSTNDFTTSEKTKLEGIEDGANNTVVDSSVTSTSSNPVSSSAIKDYVDSSVENVLAGDVDLSQTHNHDDRYIKLGTGTVTSTNILNGTIVNDDIANSTIQLGKLNSNAIDTTSGGTEGSSKLITSGAVYSKLNPLASRYEGVFVNGVATVNKPYLRLFQLKSANASSSSGHLIFEVIGNNNDRRYAKIRVDIRQNTTTDASSVSSYTITPIDTTFDLSEFSFGFIDDHTNGITILDVFKKVTASQFLYIKVYDDHLRNGEYTQYSPVPNGIESYIDLTEASEELYDTSYTETTTGDNYRANNSSLPNTNLTANSFIKKGGTSSQLLLANGGVKAVSDFANSTHNQATTSITNSETYDNLGSNLTNQKLINDAVNTKIGALTNVELVTLVTGNLPTASASTMNKLYVKTKTGGTTNDNYDIYVTVNNNGNYAWEKIDDFNLQNLSINWDSVTGKPSTFAPSTHTHKSLEKTLAVESNGNLNSITNTGWYSYTTTDSNTISNVPERNVGAVFEVIDDYGTGAYVVQKLYTLPSTPSNSKYYYRDKYNNNWSAWKTIAFVGEHNHTKSEISDFTHTHHDTDLDLNGVNVVNSVSPLDMAMGDEFNANRLAFLDGDYITVDYSTDNGVTWTEFSGVNYNGNKVDLVTTNTSANNFRAGNGSTTNFANNKLRVTIKVGDTNVSSLVYTRARKLLLYFHTGNATGTTVTVATSTYATPSTFTTKGTYNVSGMSGWNSIPFDVTVGGFSGTQTNTSSTRVQYIRLTFNQSGGTGNLGIQKIRLYGETGWTVPSELANDGHNYTFDYNKRTYFPSTIHADNTINSIYLNDELELCYDLKSYYRSYTNNESIGDLLPCIDQPIAELTQTTNGLQINSSTNAEKRFYFPVVKPTELQFTYVSGALRGWFIGILYDKKSIMWGDCISTTWKVVHEGATTTQATTSSPTATNGDIIKVTIEDGNVNYYKNNTLLVTKATEGILDDIEYYFGFYTNQNRNLVVKDVMIK